MTLSDPILELLVAQARAGDEAALGRLLELLPQLSAAAGAVADPAAAAGAARRV